MGAGRQDEWEEARDRGWPDPCITVSPGVQPTSQLEGAVNAPESTLAGSWAGMLRECLVYACSGPGKLAGEKGTLEALSQPGRGVSLLASGLEPSGHRKKKIFRFFLVILAPVFVPRGKFQGQLHVTSPSAVTCQEAGVPSLGTERGPGVSPLALPVQALPQSQCWLGSPLRWAVLQPQFSQAGDGTLQAPSADRLLPPSVCFLPGIGLGIAPLPVHPPLLEPGCWCFCLLCLPAQASMLTLLRCFQWGLGAGHRAPPIPGATWVCLPNPRPSITPAHRGGVGLIATASLPQLLSSFPSPASVPLALAT